VHSDLTTEVELITLRKPKSSLSLNFVTLACLVFFSHSANAANGYALFEKYLHVGFGKCLPEVQNADQILENNGIGVKGATVAERAALARGISQVEKLLGSTLPKKWQVKYNFVTTLSKKGKYTWDQELGHTITVRRPSGSTNGLLTGRMMHELGHKIGNSSMGKTNYYEGYKKFRKANKGKRCKISKYCSSRENEEFAEAFEAFVADPDLLKSKCPTAYAFFKDQAFPSSSENLADCNHLSRAERTSIHGDPPPLPETTTAVPTFFRTENPTKEKGGRQ
jgi:hypothetical protein